mgnify:CR=1 FL=1
MNENFNDIPCDTDTKIILELASKLNGYNILYQKWSWDGINGESVIFHFKDIIDLKEDEVIKIVKDSPLVQKDSKLTFSQKNNYVFVNFNFKTI